VPAFASLCAQVGRQAGATLAEVLPRLGCVPLDYQPGSLFRYSPLDAMDTLLYLVELVSRTPAEQFLHERIFQPLEMRRTWFNVPPSEKDDLVQIYKVDKGTFVPQRWLFGDGPFSYISGAGGLISTALDMLHFEQMLLDRGTYSGRRLLRPETVDLMATNHVGTLFADWFPPLTGGHGFGLGVRIVEDPARGGGRSVGAFGWGGAYGTETWADPALDVAAALLVQIEGVAPNVKDDFAQAIRQAIVA
jgi:CubicO group peptidase (beta-lactamase class C family)